MIGAVNQNAGDTGRSHLANRYFLRALHRGRLLDGQPGARATWTARAGPAELTAGGRKRFGCDDNTTNVGRTVVPIA